MANIANQISKGNQILGSMIAWELGDVKVTYHQLIHAMQEADLDETVVRTKMPKNAFMQAARNLQKKRVIDKLTEDKTDIKFQFTRKERQNGEVEYTRETFITMSKFTGACFCADDPDLAREVEELVSEAMDTYTGANVAHYLRQLFKENADIFSFPRDGGVYLVPAAFNDFLDQISVFVEKIGGRFNRLPIAKGSDYGDKAFRETISAQIEKTALEHIKAVEDLTADNMDRSFANRAKEINSTRYKVECYAAYLGNEAEKLLKIVAGAKVLLQKKITEAGKDVTVD